MIKIIFFDFDGVIVESVDIKTEAFAKLFEEEDKEIIKEIVDYHLCNAGISRYEKFRHIYKKILKRSLKNDEFQSLCSKFANLVVARVVAAPYVKGAKEFLEKYASRYKCFVLSATPKGEIKEIINKRNIGRFFWGIYGAPDKKSDAVKEILIKEKIEPINALYVGDAMTDYIAAKNNEVNFIARVNNNDSVFRDIDCPKIKDPTSLSTIIETI